MKARIHHGRIEEVAHQARRTQVNSRQGSQVRQEPGSSFHKDGYRDADGQSSADKTGARRLECELNSYFGIGSFETDDSQYIRVNALT